MPQPPYAAYEIYLVENDEFWYVGSTTIGVAARWERHVKGRGRAPLLFAKIQELGQDAFLWRVLEEGIGNPIEAEQRWYDTFLESETRQMLNGKRPGGWDGYSRLGQTLTEEHKQRIGDANRGRKHSDSFRAMRRSMMLGNIPAPGTRAKLAEKTRLAMQDPERRSLSLRALRENKVKCGGCELVTYVGPLAGHQKATGHTRRISNG